MLSVLFGVEVFGQPILCDIGYVLDRAAVELYSDAVFKTGVFAEHYGFAVFKIADNKVVAAVVTTTDPAFYEVDLQTGKATEAPAGNYGWINVNNVYSTMTGPDDVVYFTSGTGVYKIDVKNKQNIEVFNYSWCSTNRNYLTNAQMVECSDDRIVFCGEKYERVPMGMPSQSEPFVLTLDRAATNPHAGKTIIELYSSGGYVEDNISEAIVKYNNTSSTHYIEVRDRYSNVNSGIDYSKITSDDEMQTADLNFNAKMSNELAMDILNGEGPDILLNCSNYGQLNNTNYLADLSKYVGTLDSDKYFTNIVDAAKIDGKLYQFPVCYMVSGIFTDAKYAGKSGVGFTTAEYEKFLNDTLNGKDVINYGQAQYFTRLFTAMSEKFISDGKVDFSGPEFAELAEFVKNNVPEKAKSWNELYSSDDGVSTAYAVGVTAFKGDSTVQTQAATYTSLYGYSGYFYQMGSLQGATGFFGIPSTDGRGPMLEPYVSVAVSAQSKSEKVVGLQTDKPLKRAFMPFGGIKMAEQACTNYGYKPSEKLQRTLSTTSTTKAAVCSSAMTAPPESRSKTALSSPIRTSTTSRRSS